MENGSVEEQKQADLTLETMKNLTKWQQKANDTLGITKEYSKENRAKLWDSQQGKAAYKEKGFGDKETYIDPISQQVLHKSQKATQNKYHMKNAEGKVVFAKWAKHSAETDHINAIKDVHDVAKYNPFLSDSDFKEIINSEENYRILSKKDNTSKGKQSDWNVIFKPENELSSKAKLSMAKEKINSDFTLQKKFAVKTAKNVGQEFSKGATDTLINSAIPLTAEAARKVCQVASGEKSFSDVAKEMGKITANVAVAGGTNQLLLDTLTTRLKNSKNAAFSNLANSNQIAQIISVAAIV